MYSLDRGVLVSGLGWLLGRYACSHSSFVYEESVLRSPSPFFALGVSSSRVSDNSLLAAHRARASIDFLSLRIHGHDNLCLAMR